MDITVTRVTPGCGPPLGYNPIKKVLLETKRGE